MGTAFTSVEKAEVFVNALDSDEEYNLLVAILKSLSWIRAQRAADAAGYNLEQQ